MRRYATRNNMSAQNNVEPIGGVIVAQPSFPVLQPYLYNHPSAADLVLPATCVTPVTQQQQPSHNVVFLNNKQMPLNETHVDTEVIYGQAQYITRPEGDPVFDTTVTQKRHYEKGN